MTHIWGVFGRISAIVMASLLLSGCFGSDTQEYIVKKPIEKVYKAISTLENSGSLFGRYSEAANTIKVKRVRNESIVYHFASESDDNAAIGFRFQPSKDGKATKVIVQYDIPRVSVGDGEKFGKSKGEYYVVPARVHSQFKRYLKKMFTAIEDGEPYREKARNINMAFHAISLVTNPSKMQSLMENGTGRFAALTSKFRDGGGQDYAASASNIDASAKHGWATDNAKPMSDASPMMDTNNTTLSDY